MFGLLKKKLAGFVEKISGGGKESEEPPEKQILAEKAEAKEKVLEKTQKPKQESIFEKITKTIVGEKKEAEGKVGKAEHVPKKEEKLKLAQAQEEAGEIEQIYSEDKVRAVEKEKPAQAKETVKREETAKKKLEERRDAAQTKEIGKKKKPAREEKKKAVMGEKTDIELAEFDVEQMERLERTALSGKEREMKANVGIGKSVGSIFSPTITIVEEDVKQLLEELELSLLESDVAYEVSIEVCERLRKKLSGLKVKKNRLQEEIKESVEKVLVDIMSPVGGFDFYEKVGGLKRPVKILLVGPNGAGKTTTIAKIAYGLKERRVSCVFAASDTFRAAAIEQLQEHGRRLGVEVIKSNYGADPASVAYDAIKHAHSNKVDVVLIDSAGRQDTNANLIDEMKKINRVVSPDLKIYIGESIGGSALIEQIKAFHEAIGVDGAILTKVDCDAKGGTAISLSYSAKVPILFLGIGQKYEDLKKFDAQEVAKQIIE